MDNEESDLQPTSGDMRKEASLDSNSSPYPKTPTSEQLKSTKLALAKMFKQVKSAAVSSKAIEEGRIHAESSKSEIDAQLAFMGELVEEIAKHNETAKTKVLELDSLIESVQSSHEQLLTNKAQGEVSLESLRKDVQTASEITGKLDGIQTNAIATQEAIAEKSSHIQNAHTHAGEIRSKIDSNFEKSQQSAAKAEEQHQASQLTLNAVNDVHASVQEVKTAIDTDAAEVTSLLETCNTNTATTKNLADIAEETEQSVVAYQQRLAELETESSELRDKIESLLPDAATAGLASAFNKRRIHFKWPQIIWQGVFVASVLGLLGVAAFDLSVISSLSKATSWDQLSLALIHRLPFAAPIIWLAIHAAGKAALAQRMEEDYAFKETVSRSFEGYRREMADLEGKASPESALSRLCTGVLSVITNPPGRIHEKHPLNATPLNAIAESAKPIAKAVKEIQPNINVGE